MQTLVLNEHTSVVAGRDGLFLVNRNDAFIGRAIEIYGEFSGAECAFLKQLVKPGDHVVEVGANIGSHTVGLANAIGPRGKLYAFEPQRSCFALLQAQIALNQISNVYAYNEGVGRERGRLWVPAQKYDQLGNFGGVSLNPVQEQGAEPVDVVTLDESLGHIQCALIKIDVEGMEEDVIRGGLNLIKARQPYLYVENDRAEKSRSLIALIMELGYRLWWHLPPLYSFNNFFKNKQNLYGNIVSINMICARQSHRATEGLKEIKSPDDRIPPIGPN